MLIEEWIPSTERAPSVPNPLPASNSQKPCLERLLLHAECARRQTARIRPRRCGRQAMFLLPTIPPTSPQPRSLHRRSLSQRRLRRCELVQNLSVAKEIECHHWTAAPS